MGRQRKLTTALVIIALGGATPAQFRDLAADLDDLMRPDLAPRLAAASCPKPPRRSP